MYQYFLNKKDIQTNRTKTFKNLDEIDECIRENKHPYYLMNGVNNKLTDYSKDESIYVCFPLIYDNARNESNIKQYNPYIFVDIDIKKDIKDYYLNNNNKHLPEWKRINNLIENVYLTIKETNDYTLLKHSYSGGIHIIFKYESEQLNDTNYKDIHKQVYLRITKQINNILKDKFKTDILFIDESSNKPTQLCIINYDKDCCYNKDFVYKVNNLTTNELKKNDCNNPTTNELTKNDFIEFCEHIKKNKIECLNNQRLEIYYSLFDIYGTNVNIDDIINDIKKIYIQRVINTKENYNKKLKLEFLKYKKSYNSEKWNNQKTLSVFNKYGFKVLKYDELGNKYDDVIKLDNGQYLMDIEPELNEVLNNYTHIIIKGRPGIGKTTYFIKYLMNYLRLNPKKKVVYVSPKNLILEQIQNDYKDIVFDCYFGKGNKRNNSSFILSNLTQLHTIINNIDIGLILFDEVQNFIEYSSFQIDVLKHNNIFKYNRKHIFISGTPQLFKLIYDYHYVNIEYNQTNRTNFTFFHSKFKEYLLNEINQKKENDFIYVYKNDKDEINKIKNWLLKHKPNLRIGEIYNETTKQNKKNETNNDLLYENISKNNLISNNYDIIFSTDKTNEGININNTNIHKVVIDLDIDTNVLKILQMRYRFRKLIDSDIYTIFINNGFVKVENPEQLETIINNLKSNLTSIINDYKDDCRRYNKHKLNKLSKELIDFDIKKKTYLYQDKIDKKNTVYVNVNMICKDVYSQFERNLRDNGQIFFYMKRFFDLNFIDLKNTDKDQLKSVQLSLKNKKENFKRMFEIYGNDLFNYILGTNIDIDIIENDKKILKKYIKIFYIWVNRLKDLEIYEYTINNNGFDEILGVISLENKRYLRKQGRIIIKFIMKKDIDFDIMDIELMKDIQTFKESLNKCKVYVNRKGKKNYILLNDLFEQYKKEKYLNTFKMYVDGNKLTDFKSFLCDIGYTVRTIKFDNINKDKIIYI